jgi:hypothetical protein
MAFQRVIPVAMPTAGKIGDYEMRQGDMALVSRFVNNTVLTFGPPEDPSVHKNRSLLLANAVRFAYKIR